MSDADHDAAAALAIMREWDWTNLGPDYAEMPPGMDLNAIASRLAVEGMRRPETVMLHLFCSGKLLTRGLYRWRKYQDCSHYQFESEFEHLKPRYWQNFARIKDAASSEASGGYIAPKLELSELGFDECLSYQWDFGNSGFGYAIQTGIAPWDEDYLEEWFSAWEIEAWPRYLTETPREPIDHSIDVFAGAKSKSTRGRSAAKWWPDFAEELAVLIHEEGIPDGSGHDGQSELLDKLFIRLSAAGKVEPGRATVQPVINAVLARIRSAGK